MSNNNTKNYMEQGGDKWAIGGVLDILSGGMITSGGTQSAAIADHADPATATAADIATKQNAILAALRAVGIISAS